MAEVPEIWPPNDQLVPVTIAGVRDADGDPVTITVTGVTQDEPLNSFADASTCPDAVIVDGQAQVRAERSGTGNGRVYMISFTASDGRGGACNGSVEVCVPHDQGQDLADLVGSPDGPRRPPRLREGVTCIDDGQIYNSLGPCPAASQPEIQGQVSRSLGLNAVRVNGGLTTVQYSLPADGDVMIAVFDIAGRRMGTLVNSRQVAGSHQASWNSSRLSRGIYYYRMQAADKTLTKSFYMK